MEKAIDREPPSKDTIDKEFENRYNESYKCKDAVVDHMNAISILNRYCMSLPADQFTQSSVAMQSEKTKEGIVVKILLPIQSKYKEEISVSGCTMHILRRSVQILFFTSLLQGTPMPNIRLAKRSAAQKACVALHQCNDLSDNMLPINKKKCLDLVRDEYFKHWQSDAFKNGKFIQRGAPRDYKLPITLFQINNIWPERRKTIASITSNGRSSC